MKRPGWLTAAGLLLLAVVPAAAQDDKKQPPSAAFLQGSEAFRRILYDSRKELFSDRLTALQTFGELTDPKHTLLIVFGGFGDADRLKAIPGGLDSFVRNGGVLFLATDRPLGSVEAAVGGLTGFRVSGDAIVCDNLASCYHELRDCPLLLPQQGADPDLFRNLVPSGGDLSSVATNIPSMLKPYSGWPPPPILPQLAWLPEMCGPEGKGMVSTTPLLFGVGGNVGDKGGRVLLLADHSIFINDMIMQTDNVNLDFSYNCLKWAAGGPEPRTRVLFIEDGAINSKFDVPLKEMPDELADRLLDFLGAVLEKKAREAGPNLELKARSFDDELLRWCDDNGWSAFVLLLVVLAVFVVLYGCWRIGLKARHRPDLQGPLLAMALHRVAPTGTVVEQRRLAQVCGDNVWEPARDLARQFLVETGAAPQLPPGADASRLAVRGGWLRRRIMAGRLKRLGRLAFGPPVRAAPEPMAAAAPRGRRGEGRFRRRHGTMAVSSPSFPRSAWERTSRRSASRDVRCADRCHRFGTQSVRACVPTQSVGTRAWG